MGTPLPPVVQGQGIECENCPEPGGDFPNGLTPLKVQIAFTDFEEGTLWNEAYRAELNAGVIAVQNVIVCAWTALSTNFAWFFRWEEFHATISIHIFPGVPNFAYSAGIGALCLVEYANDIVLPGGVIAFNGKVNLTWEPVV